MKLLFAILLFSASLSAQTIAIRAGATTPYTDSTGQVWAADSGFTCPTTPTTPTGTYSVTNAITGALPAASDQALYQFQRYGVCAWTFPVANGSYNVTLKFSEDYFTAAGQRVFGVSINGTSVLSAFDIFVAASGEYKALDKVFPVTVTTGSVAIQFSLGTANYPTVDAIEITPALAAIPVPVATATTSTSQTAGTLTVAGTFNGAPVTQSFSTTSPVTFNFTAMATAHSVTLQWTETGTGITGYNIFRATTSGAFGAMPIGTSTATTYVDTGVTSGQTYYYAVQAVAGTSTSALSTQVSATIPTP